MMTNTRCTFRSAVSLGAVALATSGRLRQAGRRHLAGREDGAGRARHRRDEGHRRGRLHLRPADRDELRGHVRVLRGQELRPVQGAVQPDQQRSPRASPTRTRRSSRPTATRRIRCCGWTCAPSRSCCRCRRWRRSATTRCSSATAIRSTTVTSAAAPPATKPATTWWSAPIGRARRPPASRRCSVPRTQFSLAIFRTQLFNPDDMPNVVKVQAGYKVQPLSAYLKQPAPPRGARHQLPEDRQGTGQDELLRVSRLRAAVRPAGTGGEGNPREAGPHRHRPGQEVRLQGPLARAQGRSRVWA